MSFWHVPSFGPVGQLAGNIGKAIMAPVTGFGHFLGGLENRGVSNVSAQPVNVPLPPQLPPVAPPPSFADYFKAAYGLTSSRYAPQQGILAQQYNRLGQTRDLTGQGFDLQAQGLNAGYGFDTRNLDLEGQKLGVQKTAALRQDPLLAARENMAGQLRALLDPEYTSQTGEIKRASDYEKFQARSNATGRGALGSGGYGLQQQDIAGRRDYALEQAGFGYKRNVLNADEAVRTAGEQVAQNKDALKTLDIQAKQIGVDRDRLASNLQLGLQRLGLDKTMSVNQVLQQMDSNRLDYQMLGQRIFQEALQSAPIYQSAKFLPPAMQASLTGGGGGSSVGSGVAGSPRARIS